MDRKKIAQLSVTELQNLYPDVKCSLVYSENYQLLFGAVLSAQCTDERVNKVTEVLFKKYPDLQSFADADISELEQDIKSCGLYRAKAKSIKNSANQIINDFGGEVPDNMGDLLKLTGVGRKIANLMLGDAFGKPAIVTDTHCIRISGRLGLTDSKVPAKVEKDLTEVIPSEISSHFCHQLVQFGRDVCKARNPECHNCKLNYFCRYYKED